MKNEGLHGHVATMKALLPSERGMTLIEIVVAMCIFSVIILAVCRIYSFAYNNWIDGIQEEQIQQQMDRVMGFMERDIKQAFINPQSIPPNQAVSVINSGSEVVIYQNVGNGILDQVHYRLSGNALQRGVAPDPGNGTINNPAQWQTLLNGAFASPPLFSPDQLTNGHPNLSIGIQLTVQNPARPTEPLVLRTIYAIRGNIGLQEANPNA